MIPIYRYRRYITNISIYQHISKLHTKNQKSACLVNACVPCTHDIILQYLVSDLDKEDEDENDEQVAYDADTSDNGVDDFYYEVTDGVKVEKALSNIIFRGGRGEVVPDITRQRCVLHRCWMMSQFSAAATRL